MRLPSFSPCVFTLLIAGLCAALSLYDSLRFHPLDCCALRRSFSLTVCCVDGPLTVWAKQQVYVQYNWLTRGALDGIPKDILQCYAKYKEIARYEPLNPTQPPEHGPYPIDVGFDSRHAIHSKSFTNPMNGRATKRVVKNSPVLFTCSLWYLLVRKVHTINGIHITAADSRCLGNLLRCSILVFPICPCVPRLVDAHPKVIEWNQKTGFKSLFTTSTTGQT
jgi:hypothetical protein